MKRSLWIVFLITGAPSLQCEEFITKEGDKYYGTIEKVEPKGVVIKDAETERWKFLKFKDLSSEVAKKYGYDPDKELPRAATIATLNGESYTGTIHQIEPDGVVMQTEDGVLKIKFKEMPQDTAKIYGYDADKENIFVQGQIIQQKQIIQQSLQDGVEREKKHILELKKANAVIMSVKVVQVIPSSNSVIAKDSLNENTFYIQGIDGVGEDETIQANCYRDGNITLPDGHVFQKWIIPGKEFSIKEIKSLQNESLDVSSKPIKGKTFLAETPTQTGVHITESGPLNKLKTGDPASVSGENDFITKIDGEKVTITGYTGIGGNLVIPNTIHGIPVAVIGHEAFARKNIFSVVIPDSVTKIERRSFQACTKLTKVALPKNLEEFGGLGNQLYNLGLITLDPGNQKFIVSSEGVLFDARKNRLLAYPAAKKESHYAIPNTVTELGNHAFAACNNLLSIELPESLIKIGEDALSLRGIHTLVIPNKVTAIGTYAFRNCLNLTNVSIGEGVEEMGMGVFMGCPKLQKVQFEGNAPLIIENNTFQGADTNFKVYYHTNAKGFSAPTWVDSGGGRWNSSTIKN